MAERPDEDGLIARFFAPLATHPGAAGLVDDAAVLSPAPGEDLVLTTDALVAGVHFFPSDDPFDIARKALRVNLSDLAAKGAAPVGYLLTLALAADWSVDWMERFAAGLAADQTAFGVPLMGGDTVKTPGPVTISVTAVGSLPTGATVRRFGARVGDAIFLTGGIGDAGLGCRLLQDPAAGEGLSDDLAARAKDRYWLPRPRLALAPVLRRYATAAMDVSDGFAGDLAKLCRASTVGARVDVEGVPLDPAIHALSRRDPRHLVAALTGGDDYEILFTAPNVDASTAEVMAAANAVGVEVHWVGDVVDGEGVDIRLAGRRLDVGRGSFSHF